MLLYNVKYTYNSQAGFKIAVHVLYVLKILVESFFYLFIGNP